MHGAICRGTCLSRREIKFGLHYLIAVCFNMWSVITSRRTILSSFIVRSSFSQSLLFFQTGSTYISESMTDTTKIPTVNLEFSSSASSKKVSLGANTIIINDQQPEMNAETGNTSLMLCLLQ